MEQEEGGPAAGLSERERQRAERAARQACVRDHLGDQRARQDAPIDLAQREGGVVRSYRKVRRQ